MLTSIIIAYFLINVVSSVASLVKELFKPDINFDNKEVERVFHSLDKKRKFLLYSFTFLANCLFWLPLKLLKPLMKS